MRKEQIRTLKLSGTTLDCIKIILILTIISLPSGCDSIRNTEPGIGQAFDELAAASDPEQEKTAFLKINRLAHRLTIDVSNEKGESISLVQGNPYAVRITTHTQTQNHVLIDPTNLQYLLGE